MFFLLRDDLLKKNPEKNFLQIRLKQKMLKAGKITNMTNESNGKYEVTVERYVDMKRVSRYTSLPVKTICDWSNQGKSPCIKYVRCILFDLQDVDKAVANLKRPYLQYEKTANKIIGDLHGNGI